MVSGYKQELYMALTFNQYVELVSIRLRMLANDFPEATGKDCSEALEMEVQALRTLAKDFGFTEEP